MIECIGQIQLDSTTSDLLSCIETLPTSNNIFERLNKYKYLMAVCINHILNLETGFSVWSVSDR